MRFFNTTLITISLGIATALQISVGNIPLSWLAFPVNAALLLLLVGLCFVIQREKSQHKYTQAWATPKNSFILLFLSLVGCVLIVCYPQGEITHSWPFNVLLLLLLSNMLLATFRYKGPYRKRFYLNHIGLFVFITSLSFGAPDVQRWKAIAIPGETITQAVDSKGRPHTLDTPLTLKDFQVSYYDNGTPQSFLAKVSDSEETRDILVNSPWHRSWKEDVYLTNYGQIKGTGQQYCVIELITQPWKYLTYLGLSLTALGAILLLWGKKSKSKKA